MFCRRRKRQCLDSTLEYKGGDNGAKSTAHHRLGDSDQHKLGECNHEGNELVAVPMRSSNHNGNVAPGHPFQSDTIGGIHGGEGILESAITFLQRAWKERGVGAGVGGDSAAAGPAGEGMVAAVAARSGGVGGIGGESAVPVSDDLMVLAQCVSGGTTVSGSPPLVSGPREPTRAERIFREETDSGSRAPGGGYEMRELTPGQNALNALFQTGAFGPPQEWLPRQQPQPPLPSPPLPPPGHGHSAGPQYSSVQECQRQQLARSQSNGPIQVSRGYTLFITTYDLRKYSYENSMARVKLI